MSPLTFLPLILALSILGSTERAFRVLYLLSESPEENFDTICKLSQRPGLSRTEVSSRKKDGQYYPFCDQSSRLISRRHYKIDVVLYLWGKSFCFLSLIRKL